MIRSMLEAYLRFSIATFISLESFNYKDKNDLIAAGMSSLLFTIPFAALCFLQIKFDRLYVETFKLRF